ncbi:hypothetical protein BKA63DRAFT_206904 [Paraphoma chrysanthemicola]|nr:hypothetical protein BKA63DRAFT_206904 [Paraphoma chrysanthemicola]
MPERSHQVKIMHKIYQKLLRVKEDPKVGGPESPFKLWFWSLLTDETFGTTWCDVMQMIKQPWWSRAWVFQEYMSAEHVVLMYGGQTVQDEILQSVMYLLMSNAPSLFNREAFFNWTHARALHVSSMKQLVKIVQQWADHDANYMGMVMRGINKYIGTMDLRTLLENHSRTCKANDARDNIYAFLNIAEHDYGICVNYNKINTSQKLFVEVARKMIVHDGHLGILRCKETDFDGRSLQLPSWGTY